MGFSRRRLFGRRRSADIRSSWSASMDVGCRTMSSVRSTVGTAIAWTAISITCAALGSISGSKRPHAMAPRGISKSTASARAQFSSASDRVGFRSAVPTSGTNCLIGVLCVRPLCFDRLCLLQRIHKPIGIPKFIVARNTLLCCRSGGGGTGTPCNKPPRAPANPKNRRLNPSQGLWRQIFGKMLSADCQNRTYATFCRRAIPANPRRQASVRRPQAVFEPGFWLRGPTERTCSQNEHRSPGMAVKNIAI